MMNRKEDAERIVKIVDKIRKILSISPQNSSEAVTNDAENIGLGKEILKERYVAPDKRLNTIDKIRII